MQEAWRQVLVRSSLALSNHCVIPEVLRLEVASRLAVVPGCGAISLINLHGVLLSGSCCYRWPRLGARSQPRQLPTRIGPWRSTHAYLLLPGHGIVTDTWGSTDSRCGLDGAARLTGVFPNSAHI